MKSLPKPDYDFGEVIDKCVSGILCGNEDLKTMIKADKSEALLDSACYENEAQQGKLYAFQEMKRFHNFSDISIQTKKHYMHLYKTYFVPDEKPETRAIYDAILNAAKDDCPFCGGLGTPKNLDHFLPKSKFPQFSVFPSNLVPVCLDCNFDSKKTSYASTAEAQTLHPYFDNPIFFQEQWITADYIADSNLDEPGELQYYVNAPSKWSDIDKARVENYFEDFKLASRYAKQATSSLKSKLRSIKRELDRKISIQEIITDVIQPDIDDAPFVNYWEVGLCDALIKYLRLQ